MTKVYFHEIKTHIVEILGVITSVLPNSSLTERFPYIWLRDKVGELVEKRTNEQVIPLTFYIEYQKPHFTMKYHGLPVFMSNNTSRELNQSIKINSLEISSFRYNR